MSIFFFTICRDFFIIFWAFYVAFCVYRPSHRDRSVSVPAESAAETATLNHGGNLYIWLYVLFSVQGDFSMTIMFIQQMGWTEHVVQWSTTHKPNHVCWRLTGLVVRLSQFPVIWSMHCSLHQSDLLLNIDLVIVHPKFGEFTQCSSKYYNF